MNKERDIAYGQHSNILLCCIDFYVNDWEREMHFCSPYYQAVKLSSYNYVPCPKCFAIQRKIKLKDCQYECKKECWKEF